MRRISLVLALALAGTSLSAFAAPAFPPFPRGNADIGRWLAGQTDLRPSSVVMVGPGYLFAFIPPDPPARGDGLVWRNVREEATNMAMASRLNGRSATATLSFDCAKNQASASDVTVYVGNNLRGEPGRSVPPADWLSANPGLYLMGLARAACDPTFHRPLATASAAAEPRSGSIARAEQTPAPHLSAAETGAEHWVQFGAFSGEAAARRRWRDIRRLLPDQSAGRGARVEQAGHGRALVRGLAGPFRGPAAARFCAALKARGGDCLVR